MYETTDVYLQGEKKIFHTDNDFVLTRMNLYQLYSFFIPTIPSLCKTCQFAQLETFVKKKAVSEKSKAMGICFTIKVSDVIICEQVNR